MEERNDEFERNSFTSDKHLHNSKKGWSGLFFELVKFSFIALLIVVPFRIYIAQPFIVNGASMDPAFQNGEYLIVDQITYRFKEPTRGDVIVFRYPLDPSKFFIKRIIGLPGETVEMENGLVKITNDNYPNGLTLEEPHIDNHKDSFSGLTLDKEEYFVLGDNRNASSDSRAWGTLNRDLIIGRPVIRLLPFNKISIIPGKYSEYDTTDHNAL